MCSEMVSAEKYHLAMSQWPHLWSGSHRAFLQMQNGSLWQSERRDGLSTKVKRVNKILGSGRRDDVEDTFTHSLTRSINHSQQPPKPSFYRSSPKFVVTSHPNHMPITPYILLRAQWTNTTTWLETTPGWILPCTLTQPTTWPPPTMPEFLLPTPTTCTPLTISPSLLLALTTWSLATMPAFRPLLLTTWSQTRPAPLLLVSTRWRLPTKTKPHLPTTLKFLILPSCPSCGP